MNGIFYILLYIIYDKIFFSLFVPALVSGVVEDQRLKLKEPKSSFDNSRMCEVSYISNYLFSVYCMLLTISVTEAVFGFCGSTRLNSVVFFILVFSSMSHGTKPKSGWEPALM